MNERAPRRTSNPEWTAQPEPEVDYHRQWRDFAVRWYTGLALMVGWLPVSVGLFLYSRGGWHHPFTALILMLLWLAATLAAVWWAGEFRCPRCRRRYGALGVKSGDTNYTRGFFDKVCANCKLRKFERG